MTADYQAESRTVKDPRSTRESSRRNVTLGLVWKIACKSSAGLWPRAILGTALRRASSFSLRWVLAALCVALNHGGNKLFVVSRILKLKAPPVVFKVKHSSRDIHPPLVATTRQRGYQKQAHFLGEGTSDQRQRREAPLMSAKRWSSSVCSLGSGCFDGSSKSDTRISIPSNDQNEQSDRLWRAGW